MTKVENIMENKLEKLTERLRLEGLEKGRVEGERLAVEARSAAEKILSDARSEAERIIAQAQRSAEELTKNTQNDVRMASLQTLSALRSQVEGLITAKVLEGKVSEVWQSGEFMRSAILEAIRSWEPASENPVVVIVPEGMVQDVQGAVAAEFKDGVEVKFDGRTKVPFRIEPKEGGYYINFTQEDFNELVQQALRPKVSKFLFDSKE